MGGREMKYVIGGRELVAREWNELRDWERNCLAPVAHMLPTPAVVAVDVRDGMEIPEGFAVLGVCTRDGSAYLRLERGTNTLAVLSSTQADVPQVLPEPVLTPTRFGVVTMKGKEASLILVDIRKLLSLMLG